MEITKCPPFFRKLWAFKATILVWSGWATSAKITSTMPREGQTITVSISMLLWIQSNLKDLDEGDEPDDCIMLLNWGFFRTDCTGTITTPLSLSSQPLQWLRITYQLACGICVGAEHLRWLEWCWCVSLPRWEGHGLNDGKTPQRRPAPPVTHKTQVTSK